MYYLDFIIFPIAIGLINYLLCEDYSLIGYILSVVGGIGLFTFIEYWVHRSILHRWFWEGYHERHHIHPSEYVPLPWWYTVGPFVFFGLFLPWAVTVGMMLGYMWFFSLHHALHHMSHRKHPWLATYAKWHNVHHNGSPANYGITHPGWDLIFGTYHAYPVDTHEH